MPEFTTFVVEHEAGLLATAFLLTGDQARADDLVQAALAWAHRRWGRVGGDPLGEVRRLLLARYLDRRRRLTTGEQVLQTFDDAPADDGLRRALDGLPPRVRAVLVLRFHDGLTEDGTAQLLGWPPATVATEAAEGLRALDDHLPAAGPAPSAGDYRRPA